MKSRFSPEEHAEMGAMLAAIHGELIRSAVRTANAYPRTMIAPKKLDDAVRALTLARAALEAAFAVERPDLARDRAYFPNTEDRRKLTLAPEEKQ
ncbi:hypothetical protein ADL25_22275 [Streptomyces sp. NRRL F-5122]|uniref:hypothetical protein n=1 Tax=Streptomyces sp. NRRL F-5122 TaxID=1609098 RepID=UPI0007412638|nr:hypothetical protein [Streptomyces sp. NRRL F-5122]KUJ38963.1 hypothetical protein ADL25_22275 [Streptomyces sp. NRRL F-5122]